MIVICPTERDLKLMTISAVTRVAKVSHLEEEYPEVHCSVRPWHCLKMSKMVSAGSVQMAVQPTAWIIRKPMIDLVRRNGKIEIFNHYFSERRNPF